MNGADIPDGTVFSSVRCGKIGLYVKFCRNGYANPPSITVISANSYMTGFVYDRIDRLNFPDYKVVEELTAVVK